jgi:hypothetical protein
MRFWCVSDRRVWRGHGNDDLEPSRSLHTSGWRDCAYHLSLPSYGASRRTIDSHGSLAYSLGLVDFDAEPGYRGVSGQYAKTNAHALRPSSSLTERTTPRLLNSRAQRELPCCPTCSSDTVLGGSCSCLGSTFQMPQAPNRSGRGIAQRSSTRYGQPRYDRLGCWWLIETCLLLSESPEDFDVAPALVVRENGPIASSSSTRSTWSCVGIVRPLSLSDGRCSRLV